MNCALCRNLITDPQWVTLNSGRWGIGGGLAHETCYMVKGGPIPELPKGLFQEMDLRIRTGTLKELAQSSAYIHRTDPVERGENGWIYQAIVEYL